MNRNGLIFQLGLLLVLALCNALQEEAQTPLVENSKERSKHVLIIGAGAAGSSAAYHLAQFANQASAPVSITVFERNDYVGGRSTTVPVYDDASHGASVELGASIFVEVNRILMDAVRSFNLSVEGFSGSRKGVDDADGELERETLGIWNGNEFVLTQTLGSVSWWRDLLMKGKLLWRYGLAPLKTVALMKNVTGQFFTMYDEPLFPWKEGLSQAVEDAGLLGATALTGTQFLDSHGIGELFARELIQASTRVNYAQNLGLIHGLETMVCMATNGAMSVKGGNFQIFSNMLKASSAELRLSTKVLGIHKHANSSYTVSSTNNDKSGPVEKDEFDTIILAAPYHQADIHLSSPTSSSSSSYKEPNDPADPPTKGDFIIPPKIPYVNLHVTLFASPYLLSPAAFNLDPSSHTPEVILTTLQPSEQEKLGERMSGENVGSAGFYSISVLRTVENRSMDPPRREYVYKIFSPEKISNDFLLRILNIQRDPLPSSRSNSHPRTTLSGKEEPKERLQAEAQWVQSVYDRLGRANDLIWLSLSPLIRHFYSLLKWEQTDWLRESNQHGSPVFPDKDTVTWLRRHVWQSYPYLPPRVTFDQQRLDDAGLWYTSGIESFISTMETSTLMGKNVARLIVDEWIAESASK